MNCKRTIAITRAVSVTIALTVLLSGCATSRSRQKLVTSPMPVTSQPITASSLVDIQQLSGQIVAGVRAEFASHIQTAVETALRAEIQATGIGGDATGYRSEFGVGATLVVSLTLLLALVLSHRREVLRIRESGKYGLTHSCGKLQT